MDCAGRVEGVEQRSVTGIDKNQDMEWPTLSSETTVCQGGMLLSPTVKGIENKCLAALRRLAGGKEFRSRFQGGIGLSRVRGMQKDKTGAEAA